MICLARSNMQGHWILLVVSLTVAVAVELEFDEQLERDDIIEAVNSGESTWEAGRNFDPSLKKNYLHKLLGMNKQSGEGILSTYVDDGENLKLPKNFDARKKWHKCKGLQQIRDQGPCQADWVMAAASVLTDRACIASKMKFNSILSGANLISCCTGCSNGPLNGCSGGNVLMAWEYLMATGIVTGGDYQSNYGCQPYQLPPCEHYMQGNRNNCTSYGHVNAPACENTCYNKKYKKHYFRDMHQVESYFVIRFNNTQLQREIFKHGPLQTGLNVYEDFLSYKKGVYQHKTGQQLGYLNVKVLGWGVEKGTPYWLAANSWNSDWGDKGFFKIKRGHNECDFEDYIIAGYPYV